MLPWMSPAIGLMLLPDRIRFHHFMRTSAPFSGLRDADRYDFQDSGLCRRPESLELCPSKGQLSGLSVHGAAAKQDCIGRRVTFVRALPACGRQANRFYLFVLPAIHCAFIKESEIFQIRWFITTEDSLLLFTYPLGNRTDQATTDSTAINFLYCRYECRRSAGEHLVRYI